VVENLGKGGTGEDLNRCSPTKKFVLIGGIGVIFSGVAGHLNGCKSRDNPHSRRFGKLEKIGNFFVLRVDTGFFIA
jgi:hypothetical protein